MWVNTEQIKQVFLSLECNYVRPYWWLEEKTWYTLKELKECIKILKEIWVIEVATWFDEGTWLIAGRWFLTFDEDQIERFKTRWEITKENYQKFLLIME